MKALKDEFYNLLKTHLLFSIILSLTLLFFIHKGLWYASLGSFVPLTIMIFIFGLIVYGIKKSGKVFVRVLGFWSILILSWSGIRLLLGGINQFVKPVPEAHVSEQFGLMGTVLSLAFLVGGIYLWRYKKKLKSQSNVN